MSELHSLNTYDFYLPPEQIAQFPVSPRDHSRLLVIDRSSGRVSHRQFRDLPEFLDEKDLLVANNTRVMKARLPGKRILSAPGEPIAYGGKTEMLLLEKITDRGEGHYWQGIFNSAARQLAGFRFAVEKSGGGFVEGELVRGAKESVNGTVIARFSEDPLGHGIGELPLPHYIKEKSDESAYQTVYAKNLGSAAAPTAGLHFTPDVLRAIEARKARWLEVTLHVGLGTFRPVKTEDIRTHHMHEERFEVSREAADVMNEHRARGGRILSVGTTSVRTLETIFNPETGRFQSGSGSTSIFIYPGGRKILAVDRLLTNFHLPKSTLLMLVSTFGGRDLILRAYDEAVKEGYRFFSYGDSMLVL